MKWIGGRRSSNVEDRRGRGPGMAVGGGLGAVVVALLVMLMGGDPEAVLQGGGGGQPVPPAASDPNAPPDEGRLFADRMLASTEDVWNGLFRQAGMEYREPGLVLFSGMTPTACGTGQSAMGPFYCPLDEKAYIDLSFYRDLSERLGAPGDFARAYVLAHEVGHHVQTLTGASEQVRQASARATQEEANALSVRLELQADCYAGVWAHHARGETIRLEPGDVEEALGAAAAIGDDRLQRQGGGAVVPESFTHGTSEQRVRWFRTGLETGDPEACDTFSGGV